LNRDQKAAVIDEVAAQISDSEAVFAVDYRGISVPQAAELRTRLRDADASFRVVKNTLTERARRACRSTRGAAAAAAKALSDFRRASGGTLLQFKGGWMNGAPLGAPEIEAIAKLPSREVLYGRLVGMVASPLTGLVTSLNGLIGGLARQLQQIADEGLVGGGAPAPEPAAEAAPDPEPDPAPEETPAEETPSPDTENQED
jgi:large subunit ribosomal protein L10